MAYVIRVTMARMALKQLSMRFLLSVAYEVFSAKCTPTTSHIFNAGIIKQITSMKIDSPRQCH